MDSLKKIKQFREEVYTYYGKSGRNFPWRENPSAWSVLVSEFMLQQTQTERVIPYYTRWMAHWESPVALAAASLADALAAWVGLGYNRRCRFLTECARAITENFGGIVPSDRTTLETLPGIGTYTAGAVSCFAYNNPEIFIETNIRAAVIHYFFPPSPNSASEKVSDRDIFPILEAALDRDNPRIWYWALMDYGAALKKVLPNPSRRSAHYTKQSNFEGSLRQIRGYIVKMLSQNGVSAVAALNPDGRFKESDLYRALDGLQKDFLVSENAGVYFLNA